MPSSGLPPGGSRQTCSSSCHVRRQPSADSQKSAILAGSAVSMHKHWMRIPTCRSCPDERAASNDFEAQRDSTSASVRRTGILSAAKEYVPNACAVASLRILVNARRIDLDCWGSRSVTFSAVSRESVNVLTPESFDTKSTR